FRLGLWLKMGFIGLLGGGLISAGGSLNSRLPVFPREFPRDQAPGNPMDIDRILRSIHLGDYFHLFVIILAIALAIGLIFQYLFCRFRFILFDSIVTGAPAVGRGWRRYAPQANRYFGFWLVYRLVNWGVVVLIIGVPLWRAYKSGVFNGENSLPAFFAIIASIALGALAASIGFAIVSTLAKDFVMPVLALDDLALGDAWSAVWRVIASEPGAWAAYMGLKLLAAIGAWIALSIALVIAMVPGFIVIGIPAGILLVAGIFAFKAIGAVAGIIICTLAGLLLAAGFFCILLVLSAPVSVFFTSYALYFFGGRYPKLAALLWPQPISPTPVQQMAGTQPAS
ncbi:MAG TPA: hypothetical protein VFF39_04780, partial [Verrucomicrobiae bacterium]|nr:hypothetical protein [Verrucomicrobiae bacterium]